MSATIHQYGGRFHVVKGGNQTERMMISEITLTVTTGYWWWKTTRTATYSGTGTVWRNIETGERPCSMIESILADKEFLLKQGRSYDQRVRIR